MNEPESCNSIIHGSTLGAANSNIPYSCTSWPFALVSVHSDNKRMYISVSKYSNLVEL